MGANSRGLSLKAVVSMVTDDLMILLVAVSCAVVKNYHQLKERVFLMDSGLQSTLTYKMLICVAV